MAKKARRASASEPTLFPQTEQIKALLSRSSDQDVVSIAVPSHDRHNRELPAAQIGEWATDSMRLFADLYGGATSFRAERGVYKTDEGQYLWDNPIIVESIAARTAIQDTDKLNILVAFAKRMGKTLNQATIMLVFGSAMIYLDDYSGV